MGNFTAGISTIYHCNWLEKYSSKISVKSPRPQWVKWVKISRVHWSLAPCYCVPWVMNQCRSIMKDGRYVAVQQSVDRVINQIGLFLTCDIQLLLSQMNCHNAQCKRAATVTIGTRCYELLEPWYQRYFSRITDIFVWCIFKILISQVPQYIRGISHNAPFCNRNVHLCAHFCYRMVHCGIFIYCIVGFVQQKYWHNFVDLFHF